jgi:Tol biopolymer transport system component
MDNQLQGVILGGVVIVDIATGQYSSLDLPTSSDQAYSIAGNISLSPDNARLAYSITFAEKGEETSEIWTMRMDNLDKQLVYRMKGVINTLAWSPTGKQLTYSYQPGIHPPSTNLSELWLLDSDGTSQRFITSTHSVGGQRYGPTWSPDGRYVVFTQADDPALFLSDWRGPGTNVYVADTVTGQFTRLSTFKGRSNEFPTWSPDGKFVAFVSTILVGEPEMYNPGLVYVEVWVASVDGSQLYAVSGMARWASPLAWLSSVPSGQEK